MGTLHKILHKPVTSYFSILLLLLWCGFLTSCGGGGSSGGGGIIGQSGSSEGISLVSIAFPENINQGKSYSSPPQDAPLTQQIVFTFSGPVQTPFEPSSIQITAKADSGYTGPQVLLDAGKSQIKSVGTYEVFANIVVFTPQLPLKMYDFSMNAQIDEVPGLLPDTTYSIFVPVSTSGSIPNLKSVKAGVKNPETFKTTMLPQLYFANYPLKAPNVLDTRPKNGRTDFPVNTLTVMTGDTSFEGIGLHFDQPLYPDEDNLRGTDSDGDGLDEPNLFIRFSNKRLFAASDAYKGLFLLDREHPDQSADETFKGTKYQGGDVSLTDIAVNHAGRMTGLAGGVLFDVDYKTTDANIELVMKLDTGIVNLTGLTVSPQGMFYAIDLDTGELIRIDTETPEVVSVGLVPSGQTAKDLCFRYDGTLFLMRVEGQGTFNPMSYLEQVNLDNASTKSVVSNLPGAFVSMTFIDRATLNLVEEDGRSLWTLDSATADLTEVGKIAGLMMGTADLAAIFNEMETDPQLESNSKDGCHIAINPKGMLPFGTELEIMIRNRLDNIRTWSLSDENSDADPLASRCAAVFTTYDPGPAPQEDVFLEDFGDTVFEGSSGELGLASAIWDYQDANPLPPFFDNLVSTYGLGGSGELGDFLPLGVFTMLILDTDYQPLPLYDGSTPNITEPLVVTGGKFNFRRIHIPAGVSVFARGSNPLVFTATEDVLIEGIIDVSGLEGGYEDAYDSGFIPIPGGAGGPGAGRGGMGQPPVPPDFTAVTQLVTPTTGEDGWGPSDLFQIGGRGGYSGAKSPGPPYKGAAQHAGSRGAGGGGGSYLMRGFQGARGRGNRVPPDTENIQKPLGGMPGDPLFTDSDPDNNFFGPNGELETLVGGQGGGGAGTRWDSLNPNAAPNTPANMPVCMWDAKGGGAGGGGGAVAIHALGSITIGKTGRIYAMGGIGGGGEQVGVSNFGGAAGGGSGGAIILHSGATIELVKDTNQEVGATLDVSGGRFGDAKEVVSLQPDRPPDFCPEGPTSGYPNMFCSLSNSDGGQGGFGLIQLMVDDPENDIIPAPSEINDACINGEIKVGATLWWADPDDLSGTNDLAYYKRAFLTYESDPAAYPKTFKFGDVTILPFYDPEEFQISEPPLVDPFKTVATLSPKSYGLTKWIDFSGVMGRPPVSLNPMIPAPAFLGFQGIDPLTGLVITQNGYVENYNIPGLNDIEVEAPNLNKKNYIPEDNEVRVEFQGAHGAAPGLSVPGDDVSDWTPDITSLSGYRFIRYRVELNVAKSGNLGLNNPRPQVNFIRLRVKY